MLVQENTGLIVIDVQGKLARIVNESDKLISNLEKIIRGVNCWNCPSSGSNKIHRDLERQYPN